MGKPYIKRKSQKQEERTAKAFGGRTQIASGAIETLKGDVRTGESKSGEFNSNDFLIENKFTDANKYSLKLDIWNKIEKEAFQDNMRIPLMQIDIQFLSLVVASEDNLPQGFFDYWDITSEVDIPKTKSRGLIISDFSAQMDKWEKPCQRINFLAHKKTLLVVLESDFTDFITQNIVN